MHHACAIAVRDATCVFIRTLLILRQQHMAEVKEVIKKLQDAARVIDPTGEGTVPVSLLPGLLRSMDPNLPLFVVNEYVRASCVNFGRCACFTAAVACLQVRRARARSR